MELTIKELDEKVNQLAQKIKKNGKKYRNIYAVPRGGYLIGLILSDALRIPMELDKECIKKETLIVDDLIDSGKTLSQFPKNDKAVLFVKNGKKKSPYA